MTYERLAELRRNDEVAPHDGGCWYCHKDENLVFSIEWDTYVHLACVREALERDPHDAEAWGFARELGIAAEIITELSALRRVAEALNWLLHLHHGVSKGEGEPSDAEWLEALREAEAALADWSRVRSE